MDRRIGATRRFVAGAAVRNARKGQPGNALLAQSEDAGAEETRNLIERLNGTMHDSMSY
jgi:hypothetical protein